MSAISRRAAKALSRPAVRAFASAPPPAPAPAPNVAGETSKAKLKAAGGEPLPVPETIFPAPRNPWDTEAEVRSAESSSSAATSMQPKQKYSDTQIKMVRGLARIMGYNSRATTTIRETGRMMRGIVEGIERDKEFWYDGEL